MPKQFLTALAVVAVVFSGCDTSAPMTDAPATAEARAKASTPAGAAHDDRYVLIAKTSLPADLDALVAAAGGTLVGSIPEIGVAYARAEAGDFQNRAARTIGGLESVVPDVLMEWVPDVRAQAPDGSGAPADIGGPAADETFSFLSWPLEAINVEAAWAQGLTGAGVRVAVIDGGIRADHIDLASQLDFEASRSFVPPEATPQWDWFEENPANTFWHGTHVSGIVGAADNGVGTVGVAPGATIVGVKALHDFTGNSSGSGAFSWILDAIYYAATPLAEGGAGAHVINMSLGATLDEKDRTDGNKEAVREIKKAFDRATRYAWQQGVLVVASAGNGETNFDDAKTLLKIPAESQHVMAVSATGPIDWARGASNFERLAYYSDFGKSLVEVAAPGGTLGLFVEFNDLSFCTVSGPTRSITTFCTLFDQYFSTVGSSPFNYNWAQGTSMASPTVAGVAALVMERYGTGNPADTRSRIRSGADDLGKPGKDEVYGHGFLNAAASVGAAL